MFLYFRLCVIVWLMLCLPTAVVLAFNNGDVAIDAMGQYNFSSSTITPDYTKRNTNIGTNIFGFLTPVDLAIDSTNHRLFVVDANNNRVLVHNLNDSNQLIDRLPDNVLGQPDFNSSISATTQSGLNTPICVAYDSTNNRLFVGASGNDRVTVYDVTSITDGENAVNVLGQANFISSNATTTQSGMNNPSDCIYDNANSRLFVSESTNNRVLIYNVSSIVDGENAVNVFGQTNFTSSTANTTQSSLRSPVEIEYDSINERLFVAESTNNRVMVFAATSTIIDGANAINVLGQANFTVSSTATTQAGMRSPSGLIYDSANERLFVGDSSNRRILIFNVTSTITDGASAVNVLGQANFTVSSTATTQAGFASVAGMAYESTSNQLFAVDGSNQRVKIYNVSTIVDNEDATDLLGQYDNSSLTDLTPIYTKSNTNNNPSRLGLSAPWGIAMDSTNHRLFVADTNNNRVLIYNLNNNNQLVDYFADNILGQPNFYTNSNAVTNAKMYKPAGVEYDVSNNRLFVADYYNHRVLVFDVSEITDGETAVNVLGQSDFISNTPTTTQTGMNYPAGLSYDSRYNRLFVGDVANHRVLIFDVSTISNGQTAINVLGQSDFVSATVGVSATKFWFPNDIAYDSTHERLFIRSINNVAVLNVTSTITNGAAAVNVLDALSLGDQSGFTAQNGKDRGYGLEYDSVHDRLFVGNILLHRVMIYDTATIIDAENAINVLGQPNFTTSSSATTQSGMIYPGNFVYDSANGRLYVTDGVGEGGSNHRVTIYDELPPTLTSFSSTASNGSYSIGDTINITATFNEVLYSTSTMTVLLNSGSSVTLSTFSGSTSTLVGTYTIADGEDASDLTVSSITSALIGDVLPNSTTTYSVPSAPNNIADTSAIVVDTTDPILAEVTSVASAAYDTTPDYTFSSTEAGTITYGGDCSSVSTAASVGNNTVTFNFLNADTHANCTITVTDAASNVATVNVPSFSVLPVGSFTPPVVPQSSGGGSASTGIFTQKPSFVINNGETITKSKKITITMKADPAFVAYYTLGLNKTFPKAGLIPFVSSTTFFLPNVSGTYTLYLKYYSPTGHQSSVLSHSIVYQPNKLTIAPGQIPIKTICELIFSRDLKLGMTGNDVKQLQQYLNNNSYVLASFGAGSRGYETYYFGTLTQKALGIFQKEKNISVVYGVLDLSTRTYLGCAESTQTDTALPIATTFNRNLKLGMTGNDVKQLQQYLNSHGYPLASFGAGSSGNETSYFGNLTKQALIAFQKANGILPAEGYFGEVTRAVFTP